ncbi:MAG TPA: efflux RND transporter periplasmic adaptor subunit [Thiobacillaceae bacterium]|nr:efflux RND transporter periplasmic adaptor subunit [Thiobacillaceae bacterium]HNU64569.1 efflux RND transporter periplasmic adaptor subunit [Thiobacillaceae bacterium]
MTRSAQTKSLPIILSLALSLVLAGCGSGDAQKTKTGAAVTVQAQITVIQPVEATRTHVTPGSVVALESVKVASRLMGYIKDIAVAEGQRVKAGQRLFTIDPLDIEGAVAQARLGLQQAEDALQDAKADYQRFQALYEDEVVSRQQYEKMKLNYDMAVTRAAQAKAGLGTAQGQMRYATVNSPINGVVTQKLAMEGDIAAPGHPVLLVENPDRLQVQTSVPEAVFKTLKLGQTVEVQVDGQEQSVQARVARLSPAADPMSHTYMVKLDVAGAGLQSGAFARVLFPTGRQLILTLPRSAVQERAGITGVFVVDDAGIARYRMVRTGNEIDGQVEILSGLNPGERVVSGNADAVNNGSKVQG